MATPPASALKRKSTTEKAYDPKFWYIHQLLLQAYEEAMKSRGDESIIPCKRLEALLEGLEALRRSGVFPELFTSLFFYDIRDVKSKVLPHIELDRLTEQQKQLTFAMALLDTTFGGK